MKFNEFVFLNTAVSCAVFPKWLSELTGQTQWPNINEAPYIAQNFHDMKAIPNIPRREYGNCDNVLTNDFFCSFDCQKCSTEDDIISCDPISQTFDDGPTEATSELLDYLKTTKTKTTFFLVGHNVIEYPDVVKREKRDKHLLAVHTWSHSFLPSLTNEEVFAELQWTIWAINATAGVVPKYYRPPYGGVDIRIRAIAKQLGLITVIWDKDSSDWHLNDGSSEPSILIDDFNNWLDISLATTAQPPKKKWYQFGSSKTVPPKGLLLEHDLSSDNVHLAKHIRQKFKHKQKTVAQCVHMAAYQ